MNQSIHRNAPSDWYEATTNYEMRELWRYIRETAVTTTTTTASESTSRSSSLCLKYHEPGLFTPILSHPEFVDIIDVLLRLTQLGRNACGPILLQRIKKKRASGELNVAMMKLSSESVSTKLSHQPLLSYGQVVNVFVHILLKQDQNMCLSPSGTRRSFTPRGTLRTPLNS